MTGIFTALPEELAPLVASASTPRPAGRRVWRAKIGGEEVLLAATGEGAARAERGAARLIEEFGIRAAIGAGIAGGLSPDLREGEVIAAREVRGGDGAAWTADPGLLARARRGADRVGVVVSTPRVRWTAAEKAALLGEHPDAENAGADVESAGWARAAARAGVPFLALRVVLDPAREGLPDAVRRAWSEDGVDRRAVACRALLRPREIPGLLRLRGRTRRAMERLAGILPAMFREEA